MQLLVSSNCKKPANPYGIRLSWRFWQNAPSLLFSTLFLPTFLALKTTDALRLSAHFFLNPTEKNRPSLRAPPLNPKTFEIVFFTSKSKPLIHHTSSFLTLGGLFDPPLGGLLWGSMRGFPPQHCFGFLLRASF